MKCPICEGTMEKQEDNIDQDGVTFDSYKCKACGEAILTMPQLKALANKYRQLRKGKEVTFANWGNSLAVRIPKEFVDAYNLTAGSQAILTKDKEGIKITPS